MVKKRISMIKELVSKNKIQISRERKIEILTKFIILIILAFFFFATPQNDSTKPKWFLALLDLTLYFLIINIIVHIFRAIIVSVYRKRNKFAEDYYDNFINGMNKISFLVTMIIFFPTVLYYFGIAIKSFLTTLGLFSVAIAWIFKEKISNLIEGITIMFSDDIRLKDYIDVKGIHGRVIAVNFNSTQLQTDDGDIAYIPNFLVLNTEFINYSKGDIKRIKYEFKLSIDYFGKVEKLENFLSKGLLKKFNDLIKEETIALRVDSIDKNSASMSLILYVTRFNFTVDSKVKRHISREILRFLDRESKKKK